MSRSNDESDLVVREYPIHRWDGVLFGNNEIPIPGIYIVPDQHLLATLEANELPQVMVHISGTGNAPYDNKTAMANVQLSGITSGFRPNFQAMTGLVVVLPIGMVWNGIPLANGVVDVAVVKDLPPPPPPPVVTGDDASPTRKVTKSSPVIATVSAKIRNGFDDMRKFLSALQPPRHVLQSVPLFVVVLVLACIVLAVK